MGYLPAYGGNGNSGKCVEIETQPALPRAPLGRSAI